MSFWKTLGVGVAALGPWGPAVAAGAVVAVVVPGILDANEALDARDACEAEEKAARVKAAKEQKKLEKMVKALKKSEKKAGAMDEYFDLVIALVAMGMATASCDGKVDPAEVDEIEEFVAGIVLGRAPANVKRKIKSLKNSPPNLKTAMSLARKLESPDWSMFESVIEVVAISDGVVKKEEDALLEAFRQLQKAS